jgi:hypothetical protein
MCQIQREISCCLIGPLDLTGLLGSHVFQDLNQFPSLNVNLRIYFSVLYNYTMVGKYQAVSKDNVRGERICNQLHSSVSCYIHTLTHSFYVCVRTAGLPESVPEEC